MTTTNTNSTATPATAFVNLTPHEITCWGGVPGAPMEPARAATFPPSGSVARVEKEELFCGEVITECGTVIEMHALVAGEVTGLPAPVPGIFYIVSGQVREAVPHRMDVVSPGRLLRDTEGRVRGCAGWAVNSARHAR